jgi:hypothetical protein
VHVPQQPVDQTYLMFTSHQPRSRHPRNHHVNRRAGRAAGATDLSIIPVAMRETGLRREPTRFLPPMSRPDESAAGAPATDEDRVWSHRVNYALFSLLNRQRDVPSTLAPDAPR